MACLNLTNGNFSSLTWSQAQTANVGDVTITRSATAISITKVGHPGALNLNGDFRYAVFGGSSFILLLSIQSGPGPAPRIVFVVDITGSNLTTTQIHQQNSVQSSVALPSIAHSPGSGSLAFVFSSTGTANESNTLSIVRSDDGTPVLSRLGPVSGLTGTPSAEITATELIIHHPSGFSDSTTAPRPTGSLDVIPDTDFGEAVLGASDPTLAVVRRTITLHNVGDDCLTISAIPAVAPYSLTSASQALLPIVLDPDQEQDVEVQFAPTAIGSFSRTVNVTRTPANGAASFEATGQARNAVASIGTSLAAVAFGTRPHPGTYTLAFTVSNTGELDVTVGIPAAPAGSDFTWTSGTGMALPVGGQPITITVTFVTPGDFAATPRTITITPSQGSPRTVAVSGAGCVPNALIQPPAVGPIDFGQIERGFRTVRFREFTNGGDGDLAFRARITPGADPAHASLFGLVLPGNDITDAPGQRDYTVLPATRCGTGPTGPNTVPVAVSFFADAAPGSYSANLVVDNATDAPGQSWTFALTAVVTAPVPVDAVLVLDRSGSMTAQIGARNKMEAALAGGRLFVQLLRESADDRAAVIRFNNLPEVVHTLGPVAGNRPALQSALGAGNFTPTGATNIAGGVIVGDNELIPHPSNPPVLKKAIVVLTDGIENTCFQDGGSGPWFSITGRDPGDPPEGMFRPDGTPQPSDPLPTPVGVKLYAIGLGNPADVDGPALDTLATATGASYEGVVELSGKDYFLLEKYFTQIFMDTASLAQISDPFYTINPGDTHGHEFDIFPGDVNAMVVIYDEPGKRLPFLIVTPGGEVLSGTSLPPGFGVRFHSTPTARFCDFFFPTKEPDRYAGTWKVIVEHQGRVCDGPIEGPKGKRAKKDVVGPGFLPEKCRKFGQPVDYGIAIGAGSNLRMFDYVEPGTKFVGESIRLTAEIQEAGLPVTGATVKVEVQPPFGQTYTVDLRDDGASDDGQADDGEYAGVFRNTSAAGVYRFGFRATGIQPAAKPISWERSAERTKTIYDKRRPPGGGDPGGGEDPCCKRLVVLLREQSRLLEKIAKESPAD